MAEAKRSRHETAHLLNGDVVGEIISFLSFKELLRYQRVQKQWQNIIREHSSYAVLGFGKLL
jgi:hypothetical protein